MNGDHVLWSGLFPRTSKFQPVIWQLNLWYGEWHDSFSIIELNLPSTSNHNKILTIPKFSPHLILVTLLTAYCLLLNSFSVSVILRISFWINKSKSPSNWYSPHSPFFSAWYCINVVTINSILVSYGGLTGDHKAWNLYLAHWNLYHGHALWPLSPSNQSISMLFRCIPYILRHCFGSLGSFGNKEAIIATNNTYQLLFLGYRSTSSHKMTV